MKISKDTLKNQVIVESNMHKFVIGWFAADLYWIMPEYTANNSFVVKRDTPFLWDFFNSLFSINHFPNNTFMWKSEARLESESSTLKVTKGKEHFKIRFIQNDNDYLAKFRNICPICFCLSGSRNQKIANEFSNLLHNILSRDLD